MRKLRDELPPGLPNALEQPGAQTIDQLVHEPGHVDRLETHEQRLREHQQDENAEYRRSGSKRSSGPRMPARIEVGSRTIDWASCGPISWITGINSRIEMPSVKPPRTRNKSAQKTRAPDCSKTNLQKAAMAAA